MEQKEKWEEETGSWRESEKDLKVSWERFGFMENDAANPPECHSTPRILNKNLFSYVKYRHIPRRD